MPGGAFLSWDEHYALDVLVRRCRRAGIRPSSYSDLARLLAAPSARSSDAGAVRPVADALIGHLRTLTTLDDELVEAMERVELSRPRAASRR